MNHKRSLERVNIDSIIDQKVRTSSNNRITNKTCYKNMNMINFQNQSKILYSYSYLINTMIRK